MAVKPWAGVLIIAILGVTILLIGNRVGEIGNRVDGFCFGTDGMKYYASQAFPGNACPVNMYFVKTIPMER